MTQQERDHVVNMAVRLYGRRQTWNPRALFEST